MATQVLTRRQQIRSHISVIRNPVWRPYIQYFRVNYVSNLGASENIKNNQMIEMLDFYIVPDFPSSNDSGMLAKNYN